MASMLIRVIGWCVWCLLKIIRSAEAIQLKITIQTHCESLTMTKEWWK